MTRDDAEIEFELICREWSISREKAPPEEAPQDVSTDIYTVPASRNTVRERRRPRYDEPR
ncbi:MAG: hypothetical protein JXB04_02345 [Kiritimatiellae bacterium]|nr:hypothetical protein [Kiritimatiellia bacterium]